MPEPGRAAAPGVGTEGGAKTTGQAGRHDLTALGWLVDEIEGVVEQLHAARLTVKAGHVPVVHLRRAAVRLVALDAAIGDDLALVGAMRPETDTETVTG